MQRYLPVVVVLAALLFTGGCTVAGGELKVGDPAPSFALKGSDGTVHTLGEYAGKQAVVIAWFPKAFTGG